MNKKTIADKEAEIQGLSNSLLRLQDENARLKNAIRKSDELAGVACNENARRAEMMQTMVSKHRAEMSEARQAWEKEQKPTVSNEALKATLERLEDMREIVWHVLKMKKSSRLY